jgi:hypothetical protein
MSLLALLSLRTGVIVIIRHVVFGLSRGQLTHGTSCNRSVALVNQLTRRSILWSA